MPASALGIGQRFQRAGVLKSPQTQVGMRGIVRSHDVALLNRSLAGHHQNMPIEHPLGVFDNYPWVTGQVGHKPLLFGRQLDPQTGRTTTDDQ